TEVCIAQDGRYAGRVRFSERLRPGAAALVRRLADSGVQLHLLSGDTRAACAAIGAALGLEPAQIHHSQSPDDKLAIIERLQQDGGVAFVGDGLNDGPALAAAQLGVAAGEAT